MNAQTTAAKTAPATKAEKVKKEPVELSVQLIDRMKKGAMANKLDAAALDRISAMALALKTFMSAP